MSTTTKRFATVVLVAFAVLALAGCTVYERKYPGRTPDQVWSAMVAVAQQPDYDSEKWGKWHVTTNEVWVDEPEARIEVYRKLRRVVYNAGMVKPDEQDREYRMTMRLRDAGVPRIRFETRAFEIPADGYAESQRFFDDVGALLEGMPVLEAPTVTEAPHSNGEAAAPAPPEASSDHAIDIDDTK